ncbi:hypothetical protein PsB1_2291 [Candidatus Phycosocius spiralis]|uniref:Uncharacterized protein n=1 Tax=Candidatus Phycosocius spiralis TaxID=2815099 RepID=A0ABQ4PYJ2_9PROT|nr:hypothetical protein [Candidatus Phycosocius spiralis]GIU68137.1 hypothetical protein PsB1_2291 [Candidatus Phycosocius spiralis]
MTLSLRTPTSGTTAAAVIAGDLAAVRFHFVTALETEGLLRAEDRAVEARVRRPTGMNMGIAKIGAVGKLGFNHICSAGR